MSQPVAPCWNVLRSSSTEHGARHRLWSQSRRSVLLISFVRQAEDFEDQRPRRNARSCPRAFVASYRETAAETFSGPFCWLAFKAAESRVVPRSGVLGLSAEDAGLMFDCVAQIKSMVLRTVEY